MKRVILFFLLLPFFFNFYSMERVGYTLKYSLRSETDGKNSLNLIYFKDASFIKIHLKLLNLREKDELILKSNKGLLKIQGPLSGSMWLPSISSEAVEIELINSGGEKSFYEIDEIGLGFKEDFRIESICGEDDRRNPACYGEEMQKAGDAVGRMLFQSGGYWYRCTGFLVSKDGHFLTNNHCLSDQLSANTLEVWWRYQSSTCEGTTGDKEYTSLGAQFINTNANLDYTLLLITDENIKKYGFLEIANRIPQKGERIWIPQHGGGYLKTFAVESDMDPSGLATVIEDNLEGWVKDTDFGYYADTEGGSSGSPVLDSENKVLGLHHFGLPSGYSCGYYMNQAVKMSLIYPEIAQYIGVPIPPKVNAINKLTDPFRLIVVGENFKEGIKVYINEILWGNVSYKSSTKLVLKKGSPLKALFPKGVDVPLKLVNPDGGSVTVYYRR